MTEIERYDRPAQVPAMLNPEVDAWIARLEPAIRLTELTYNSSMIPAALKGKREDVLAAFIRSSDLGVPPFVGISQMHVISGRVGISAELMRALILRAGHELQVTHSDSGRCVIRGRRSGWSDWTSASYTIEEAARAGDVKRNPNYGTRPADMLLARATTRLARMVFADVISGLRSIEELEDLGELEPGEMPAQLPSTTTQVSRQGATPAPPAVESGPAASGGAAPLGKGEGPEAGAAGSEQQPPAAPARKKPPLSPRGRATQPVPEPTPEPALDAEAVEDAPENDESATVTPLNAARSAARDGVVTTIQMHFERLLGKPVDREERIWYTGLIVGHPVESTNDLDADERRKVLKVLERMRNREQLEALNQGGGE